MTTVWRPTIRYAVMAWFGFGLAWSIAAPFWLVRPVAEAWAMVINFGGTPSADLIRQSTSFATTFLWVWSAVTAIIDVVVLAGAVRRSDWTYAFANLYLGLWAVPFVSDVSDIQYWGGKFAFSPMWADVVVSSFAGVSTALGAWMLIAVVLKLRHNR